MFRFLLFFFFFFFSLHLICLLHHVKDTAEVTPRPKERKNQETRKNKKWLHASTVCALAVLLCSTGICRTSHRLVCRACRVAHVVGLHVALHTAERERERKKRKGKIRERDNNNEAHCFIFLRSSSFRPITPSTFNCDEAQKKGG